MEHLLTVTARMADSVIACDNRGQMLYANPAARSLFGKLDFECGNMDECSDALSLFDCHGERPLDPEELPLAQAAYEGRVVRAHLTMRQEESSAPIEATAFPVHDQSGRQVGAMMVCRNINSYHHAVTPHLA
jgi:PAS domain-containing protein